MRTLTVALTIAVALGTGCKRQGKDAAASGEPSEARPAEPGGQLEAGDRRLLEEGRQALKEATSKDEDPKFACIPVMAVVERLADKKQPTLVDFVAEATRVCGYELPLRRAQQHAKALERAADHDRKRLCSRLEMALADLGDERAGDAGVQEVRKVFGARCKP